MKNLLMIFFLEGEKATGRGCEGLGAQLLMILLIFAVFWFIVISPQRKRQKEHQKMLENLKRGDKVITAGGIIGKVDFVGEKTVKLEIADKVKIEILKQQIMALYNEKNQNKQK